MVWNYNKYIWHHVHGAKWKYMRVKMKYNYDRAMIH